MVDNLWIWLPFAGSILVVILGWWFGRHKQSADIVAEISIAASHLIEPLNQRIGALEQTVSEQEGELDELRSGINVLIDQIRCLGQEPKWTPETKARLHRIRLPEPTMAGTKRGN